MKRINSKAWKRPDLFIAFELGANSWKLAFSNGSKQRFVSIDAGNGFEFEQAYTKTVDHFKLGKRVHVVSCYEAGRDGFWLHRYLCSRGIENLVVDSSSIEVPQKKRRVKTDRIDVHKLLSMLIRHHEGEKHVWRVVHVPSEEAEDLRRVHRERERLIHERQQHAMRIQSLLILHNIRLTVDRHFGKRLESMQCWNGEPVPPELRQELIREFERWRLVSDQIRSLEACRRKRLAVEQSRPMEMVRQLMRLRALGVNSSWLFVMEFFAWRDFRNRREVGNAAGMTGTPYNSGESERDQGISKAGNDRVRAMAVEISWLWLRHQPNSELTQWFNFRFASGGKRMRRVGIVALGRRLLISLWRYLEQGIVPGGATLKPV